MPADESPPNLSDGRTIDIRPLRSGDLDPLLRFANALVKEKKSNRKLGVGGFDKRVTRKFEEGFLRGMLAEAKAGDGVNFAAFAGKKLAGFCNVKRRNPMDLHHTGVLGIVVLPEWRGIGVGKRLMTRVLRGCSARGIWLVELEVMASNSRAQRLYESLGFRRVGVVPGKVLRDGKLTDIVAMYIDLRGTDKSPGRRRGRV